MKTFNDLTKKKYIDSDIIELKEGFDLLCKVSEHSINHTVKHRLFPFTKGLVKLAKDITLAFNIDDENILIEIFNNKLLMSMSFILDSIVCYNNDANSMKVNASWNEYIFVKSINGEAYKLEADVNNEDAESIIINCFMPQMTKLMALFTYINDINLNEPILLKTKIQSNKKLNKKNKSKNNRVSYINQRKFIVDGNEPKTKRKKHCVYTVEKWTNRGHYRTLKDGSKIWIKPFIKHRHAKNIDSFNKNKIYKVS